MTPRRTLLPRHRAAVRVAATLVAGTLTGALAGTVASVQAAAPERTRPATVERPGGWRHLRAQVLTAADLGTVAVGMPDARTVQARRLDPATGAWGAPTTLLRTHGRVTCGRIDARTSPRGVALTVECDTPFYDDQAPTHSRGLVTTDLVHWARHRLPGEAYSTPAVSPSGGFAAWLAGPTGGYVEWSAAGGWLAPATTTYDDDSGAETVVVDDAGTVSVVGPEGAPGAPGGAEDGDCVIGVHSRTLDGGTAHEVVGAPGLDLACGDGSVDGVDDLTVVGGQDRASRFVVSRPDAGSPWRLTRVPPDQAPGLVQVVGQARSVRFVDVAGQPLAAVSQEGRRRLVAQLYDDDGQRWGPPEQVLDSDRPCRWTRSGPTTTLPVVAVALRCGGRATLVTGSTWAAVRVLRPVSAWTIGAGGVLAVPKRDGVLVVSPVSTVRFPRKASGRCDVVVATGPTSLVRLHAGSKDRWPRLLQTSADGSRWHTARTLRMPRTGRCLRVATDPSRVPTPVVLVGSHGARTLHGRDYRAG